MTSSENLELLCKQSPICFPRSIETDDFLNVLVFSVQLVTQAAVPHLCKVNDFICFVKNYTSEQRQIKWVWCQALDRHLFKYMLNINGCFSICVLQRSCLLMFSLYVIINRQSSNIFKYRMYYPGCIMCKGCFASPFFAFLKWETDCDLICASDIRFRGEVTRGALLLFITNNHMFLYSSRCMNSYPVLNLVCI